MNKAQSSETLFKIYVGVDSWGDNAKLREIISRYLPSWSLIPCIGSYNGNTEPATFIEFLGLESDRGMVVELAYALKREFDQESIMVSETNGRLSSYEI